MESNEPPQRTPEEKQERYLRKKEQKEKEALLDAEARAKMKHKHRKDGEPVKFPETPERVVLEGVIVTDEYDRPRRKDRAESPRTQMEDRSVISSWACCSSSQATF